MLRESIPVRLKREPHEYLVHVGSDLLGSAGEFAAASLPPDVGRIMLVSNPKVFGLYGKKVSASLRRAGYKVETFLMGDGERHKSLATAERLLKAMSSCGISRSDAVAALGGGVVGDLAGFVSAVHLRGVPFVQIPTTLLAMIDSSVGGKTAVNTAFGKNMVGAFHQPSGVLVDVGVLATLDRRELTAGLCEAVKHGLLSGNKLFAKTASFIGGHPAGAVAAAIKGGGAASELAELVAGQIDFKRKIVSGDEAESPERRDPHSRKILNLGHTFAHALEKVTLYRRFKHGEAVGHGLRFATRLSAELDLLSPRVLNTFNKVVNHLDQLPSLRDIDRVEVLKAFKFDKKAAEGSVQLILLEGIGCPRVVDSREIPAKAVRKAVDMVFDS